MEETAKRRYKQQDFQQQLGVDIYIVENESDKKTINTASKNWQSTFAVKYLEDVVVKSCWR